MTWSLNTKKALQQGQRSLPHCEPTYNRMVKSRSTELSITIQNLDKQSKHTCAHCRIQKVPVLEVVFQILSHSMPLQEGVLLLENICLLWKQDANRYRSVSSLSKTHNVLLLILSCHLLESHDIAPVLQPPSALHALLRHPAAAV